MISASAADAHRFGRVKRNGYDPDEVDAVVARLIETLRKYEERTDRLEERLAEADASADAIRKTFIAAERTRDEILDSARDQAEAIRSAATADAEELVEDARLAATELTDRAEAKAAEVTALTRELDRVMASRRARTIESAYREAEQILLEAEEGAAARSAEVMDQADGIIDTARGEAERLRSEAAAAAQASSIAAAWTRREAMSEATSIIGNAEERAALIIAEAERDGVLVHQRVAQLRDAIASLEASAKNLAEVTATEVSVIDLSKIEAVEADDADEVLVFEPESRPVMAVADSAAMDTTMERVAERGNEPQRLLTVAEATAALEVEEAEGRPDQPKSERDTGPKTYYQRSTGVPLSERVKIARKSG